MHIRPATIQDVEDLALIHIEGWRAAYDGQVDRAFLDGLDRATYAANWAGWLEKGDLSCLIAHDDSGQAAGFISFGRLRTPVPGGSPIRPLYSGEIYALYILPSCWRAGLGRRLMAAAAAGLREQKHRSACLWVLDGNKRATAFYKALGGQKCGTKKVEIGGKTLLDAAYGWRDTGILQMPSS